MSPVSLMPQALGADLDAPSEPASPLQKSQVNWESTAQEAKFHGQRQKRAKNPRPFCSP